MQETIVVKARCLRVGDWVRVLQWEGWSWQRVEEVQIISDHTMYVETELGCTTYIPDTDVQIMANPKVK
jgi:hypothetical protein